MLVEILARQMAYVRRFDEIVPAGYLARIDACLSKLGMTPADRSRVQIFRRHIRDSRFAEFE